MDLVKLAIMGLNEAKELKRECEKEGIEIILNHNEKNCTRGCSVTVEVHAFEGDLDRIQKIHIKKHEDLLEGHNVDLETLNSVFDSSQELAICPACGTQFSTKSSECPDCGLVLL